MKMKARLLSSYGRCIWRIAVLGLAIPLSMAAADSWQAAVQRMAALPAWAETSDETNELGSPGAQGKLLVSIDTREIEFLSWRRIYHLLNHTTLLPTSVMG
jgi:hypothetical protein